MFSINIKAYPSSCDEQGKMRLYRVMQAMQDCSELWLQSEPLFEQHFKNNGMAQLLAYRQLDIIRVPQYGEDLQVRTSIYEVNPMFGYRNTCIYDNNNRPCYVSWGMGAFVNRETGRLQKVPDDVLQSVKQEAPVDMEYTERRIIVPQGNFIEIPDVAVMPHDIDYNHHVNNAEYLRIALDLIPKEFIIRRIRIEYKIPAKLGDRLKPAILHNGNDIFVVLSLENRISTIFQFQQ